MYTGYTGHCITWNLNIDKPRSLFLEITGKELWTFLCLEVIQMVKTHPSTVRIRTHRVTMVFDPFWKWLVRRLSVKDKIFYLLFWTPLVSNQRHTAVICDSSCASCSKYLLFQQKSDLSFSQKKDFWPHKTFEFTETELHWAFSQHLCTKRTP